MIAGQIFRWAERAPDRTAIVYNGRPLSYGAFAERIATARGYFARRGYVGAGYAVLAVHNLLDFWSLSLALRSLGLTTVVAHASEPLDLRGLPNVRCVVTTAAESAWPGLDGLCAAQGLALLTVSLDGESALGVDETGEPHPPGGHVLQTSGTTGAYKMVLMSPEIDSVFLQRKANAAGLNEESLLCVFGFTPWTGVGYKWAASPWCVGGATLIEQESKTFALSRPGITHAVTVPAILSRTLAAPEGSFPRNEAMRLIVGGGAMTRSQIDQARTRITSRIFSELASTEGGDIAFTALETPDDCRWHRLAPGRAVEIVDEFDRPVPAGEVGRLRVGTAGGPVGYLEDEAATRAFFKDGFFYPGDLAVYRSDGRIALEGRLTDIINVHGQKISPAPIEAQLAEILGGEVCLFSAQDSSGEEAVHVAVESAAPIERERLVELFGRGFLGFPKVVVHLFVVLPRNQMGKVLRQHVRVQALARSAPAVPAQ